MWIKIQKKCTQAQNVFQNFILIYDHITYNILTYILKLWVSTDYQAHKGIGKKLVMENLILNQGRTQDFSQGGARFFMDTKSLK